MSEALLVQYRVLSDQRLHFGRLFWQSIAFLFLLLLASMVVFTRTHIVPLWCALIGLGVVTLLMGFVAERLRKLEGRYEDLLEAIELSLQAQGHDGIQIAPKSGRRGARFVITLGLLILGMGIILLGLLELFAITTR